MGLFSIAPAQRFLDGASGEHIHAGARILLSGFLAAIQAHNIYFKYGMHPLMREMMLKGAFGGAQSQRIGAGGSLLSSIGDDDETTAGDPRVVKETPEVAVETCAVRLSKLSENPGVSRGIKFGINGEPSSPKSSWSVVLHRGPMPLLQMELSDISGFDPPRAWFNSITKSDCAHIVQKKWGPCWGRGDHLFLMLKRTELFPYSKGKTSTEAVTAGQRLRGWCAEVIETRRNLKEFQKLSNWNSRRKRFVRDFDTMLVEHVGAESMDKTLREMGTFPEVWFHSHD